MRMWMVDPGLMCDKHLLGEHCELHMFVGTLLRGKSVKGFLDKGLLEPASLQARHNALVAEMICRGMHHESPLPVVTTPAQWQLSRVDVGLSRSELSSRCEKCRYLLEGGTK